VHTKSIAVIGIGTAGLQTLCHLCIWLEKDWKITSISDPSTPVVRIGESTNPPFANCLQMATDFNVYDHLDEIGATIKVGTVFKKWRRHNFINPLFAGSLALHIDSWKMQQFVLPSLKKRWGDKIEIKTQKVKKIEDLDYDYIVDCGGFPKAYKSNYILPQGLMINRAITHNIKKQGRWNYTGHRATKNGWMFEIPLKDREAYGYLFNDTITSKEEAMEDFSKEIDTPVNQLDGNIGKLGPCDYSFKPYYAKKLVEGRIFKNGNRLMFFEPLSANSLFIYNTVNRLIVDRLQLNTIKDDQANKAYRERVEGIRDLIYYYYHGGSTYNTPFWIQASTQASKELDKSESFKKLKKDFKHYNKLGTPYRTPTWGLESYGLKIVDEQMGYNYFKEK